MTMTVETEGVTTEADKVNTGALGTIVVVGALALVGIAGALTALVRSEQEDVDVSLGARANLRAVQELRKEQGKALTAEPSYVDRNQSLVSIPISNAMTLVLRDLEKDPRTATPLSPEEKKRLEEERKRAAEAVKQHEAPGEPTETVDEPTKQQPTGDAPEKETPPTAPVEQPKQEIQPEPTVEKPNAP